MQSKSTPVGILCLVAAMMCFSILDTTNKYLMTALPLMMVLWFRYAAHSVLSAAFLIPKRGFSLFKTQRLGLQCLRGFLLLMSSYLAFLSLQRMPVAEFAAIAMLTPLLVMMLSHFILKEPVSMFRNLCVLGGLLGGLIIVRPGGTLHGWDPVWPLAMSFSNAFYQILTGYLAKSEDSMTLHLYTGWVGFLITSVFVIFWWETDLTPLQWLLMCLSGIMGTLGHYMLIAAFSKAPANRLAPFLYLQIAFSWAAGWVVFSYNPQGLELQGMCLITLCGVAAAWRGGPARAPTEVHVQSVGDNRAVGTSKDTSKHTSKETLAPAPESTPPAYSKIP
jgi:drug/metabolite transporter (DMT)-like permease